ncbi:MAG: TIGR03085 family metal-binding protein [Actinomycetes bacterium]
MTSPAAAERAALLTLMAERGPDARTLLPAWTTHDLAAHLVVRERQPWAVPGLVVPPLRRATAALERRARTRPYEDLLARLRSGPPPWSPGGALRGPLDGLTDLHEFFVHHEDVRRADDPAPRRLDADLDRGLWDRVRVMGPGLTARARGLRIVVEAPGGRRATLRPAGDPVVVRGEPGELLLWLFGRREVADVELVGSADARARAATARLGW